MKGKPRILFFGTPAFAVPSLRACTTVGDVIAVITRPAKPAGRGQPVTASPVQALAQTLRVETIMPFNLRAPELLDRLRSLRPDVAVLAAYGKILPHELLMIPEHGFVNVHPSLLPRHRGPSPIAATILSGDELTGVTLMLLDDEMDHGPIITQQPTPIGHDENRGALEDRLSTLGASLLETNLSPYLKGGIKLREQNHEHATYSDFIRTEDAVLNWHNRSDELVRRIRAFAPIPGARTSFQGFPLKILSASIGQKATAPPGTVIIENRSPAVSAIDRTVRLQIVQSANGNVMTADAFLHGHRDFIGATL